MTHNSQNLGLQKLEAFIVKAFHMDDATWSRHASPWSVFTRATVLPVFAVAIWSRVWIGWWSLGLVVAALLWTWLNPRLFSSPKSMDNWASQSVLGERIWLNRSQIEIPRHHRVFPNVLNAIAAVGLVFVIGGVVGLDVWPTMLGLVLCYAGKFWFLDRMVWLYNDTQNPELNLSDS